MRHQCDDILSRQAIIYLQTSCWSLAQRSRLMTLEQDSKSEENCNLRSAKAGHSSNICLSSPNAPVLHKLHTRPEAG